MPSFVFHIVVLTSGFLAGMGLCCAFFYWRRPMQGESPPFPSETDRKSPDSARRLRILLENTRIGIFTLNREGQIEEDYSLQLEAILGRQDMSGKDFSEIFLKPSRLSTEEQHNVQLALDFSMGSHVMFFDANALNFPRELHVLCGRRIKALELEWIPIFDHSKIVEQVLISVRDITETLAFRQQALENEAKLRHVSELMQMDPSQFTKFGKVLQEGLRKIGQTLESFPFDEKIPAISLRPVFIELHTLKCSARMNHLSDLTQCLHQAENLISDREAMLPVDVKRLMRALDRIAWTSNSYDAALMTLTRVTKEVDRMEHAEDVEEWTVRTLLKGIEPLLLRNCDADGKAACQIISEIPDSVRWEARFFEAFEKAFAHMVSNALDHGMESPEERKSKNKPVTGTIRLFIDEQGRLAVQDDGRGIHLEKLERKAEKLGHDQLTRAALLNLLFTHGFSTKDSVDLSSGRGVGLDAARQFMLDVGSDIVIVPTGEHAGYLAFYFALPIPEKTLQKAS